MPNLGAYPYDYRDEFGLSDPIIGSSGAPPATIVQAINAEDGTHWLDFEPVTNNVRAVFEFDLSSLPVGAIPTGVQLEFCIERGGGSTSGLKVRTAAIDGNGNLVLGPDERPIRGASGPPRIERLVQRRTLAKGELWSNYGNICAVVTNFGGSDLTGVQGHFCRLVWLRAVVEYAGSPPAAVSPSLSGTIAVPVACGWRYEQEDGVPQTHYRVAISSGATALAAPDTFTGWVFDTGRVQGVSTRSVSLAEHPLPDGSYRQYVKVWGRLSDGSIVESAWVSSSFTVAAAPARPTPPAVVNADGWDSLRGGAAVTVEPLGAGTALQMQRSVDAGRSWVDVSTSARGYDYEALIAKHQPTHLFDAMDLATPDDMTLPNRGSADSLLRFDVTNPGVRVVSDGRKRFRFNGGAMPDTATVVVNLPATTEISAFIEASVDLGITNRIVNGRVVVDISAGTVLVFLYTSTDYAQYRYWATTPAVLGIEDGRPFQLRARVDLAANSCSLYCRPAGADLLNGWGTADVVVSPATASAGASASMPAVAASHIQIGGNGAAAYFPVGDVWRAAVIDHDAADAVMFDVHPEADISDLELLAGVDTFTATSGQAVTVGHGATGIPLEVVDRSVWQAGGVAVQAEVDCNPDFNTESVTIVSLVNARPSAAASLYECIFATRDSASFSGNDAGLFVGWTRQSAGIGSEPYFVVADGVSRKSQGTSAGAAQSIPWGETGAVALRFDHEAQTIELLRYSPTGGLMPIGTAQPMGTLGDCSGPHGYASLFATTSGAADLRGQSPVPFAAFPSALTNPELAELCAAMIESGSAGIVRDFGVPLETRAIYRARSVNVAGDAVSDWVVSASPVMIDAEALQATDPLDGRENAWWILVPADQALNLQPIVETYDQEEIRTSAVTVGYGGNAVALSPNLGRRNQMAVYTRNRAERIRVEALLNSGHPFRLIDVLGDSGWFKLAGSVRKKLWRTAPLRDETTGLRDFHVLSFEVLEVREPGS